MNHYAPQELTDAAGLPTGRWHYCCTNGRGSTFAVGYCGLLRSCRTCSPFTPPTNPFGRMVLAEGETPDPAHCPACNGTGVTGVPAEDRCPGHDSPEEACEHYKQYLLDNARLRPETADMLRQAKTAHRCQAPGCRKMTVGHASWGGHGYASLCDKHCTRAVLSDLVTVGESFQS